jgi:hypothetical protein
VVMPWLMWCSGLAESSSPLMTATGPAHTKRDMGSRSGHTQSAFSPIHILLTIFPSLRTKSIRKVFSKYSEFWIQRTPLKFSFLIITHPITMGIIAKLKCVKMAEHGGSSLSS